jgi:hypothetical protein
MKVNEKECCATCHFWRRDKNNGVFRCNNVDSDNVGHRTKPMYGCFQYTKEGRKENAD